MQIAQPLRNSDRHAREAVVDECVAPRSTWRCARAGSGGQASVMNSLARKRSRFCSASIQSRIALGVPPGGIVAGSRGASGDRRSSGAASPTRSRSWAASAMKSAPSCSGRSKPTASSSGASAGVVPQLRERILRTRPALLRANRPASSRGSVPDHRLQSSNTSQKARMIARVSDYERVVNRQPVGRDTAVDEAVVNELEVLAGVEVDDARVLGRRRLTGDQVVAPIRGLEEEAAVLDVDPHARIVQRVVGRIGVEDLRERRGWRARCRRRRCARGSACRPAPSRSIPDAVADQERLLGVRAAARPASRRRASGNGGRAARCPTSRSRRSAGGNRASRCRAPHANRRPSRYDPHESPRSRPGGANPNVRSKSAGRRAPFSRTETTRTLSAKITPARRPARSENLAPNASGLGVEARRSPETPKR